MHSITLPCSSDHSSQAHFVGPDISSVFPLVKLFELPGGGYKEAIRQFCFPCFYRPHRHLASIQYAQNYFYCDPGSRFYQENHGNERYHSLDRKVEAEAEVENIMHEVRAQIHKVWLTARLRKSLSQLQNQKFVLPSSVSSDPL